MAQSAATPSLQTGRAQSLEAWGLQTGASIGGKAWGCCLNDNPQICHNNVALFQEERVDVHWVYLKCICELSPRDTRAVHTPQRALTRPVLSVMGPVKSVTQAAAHVVQTMRFWLIFLLSR